MMENKFRACINKEKEYTGCLSADQSINGCLQPIAPMALEGLVFNQAENITGRITETLLKGLSAYEIAVKYGFEGTEEDWIKTLSSDIEILEDTPYSFILKFISQGKEIITPNLKVSIQPIPTFDIENILKEVSEYE